MQHHRPGGPSASCQHVHPASRNQDPGETRLLLWPVSCVAETRQGCAGARDPGHAQDAHSFQNDSQTRVAVSLKQGTKCHKTGFAI